VGDDQRQFQGDHTKPDNVPIVILIFSVGFLPGWHSQGVVNDLGSRSQPPLEKSNGEERKKSWCGRLVYTS